MKKKNLQAGKIFQMVMMGIFLFSFTGMASAADILKWTGCGITKKAFMAELAKAYQAKTGTLISLSGGGATKGIRSADSTDADMGGNCRPALPKVFPAEESNVDMYLVAWDALVPVVHKKNPIVSISSQQLKDVLTGKITNWKELGGLDKPILVVARTGKISGVGYMTRKTIFKDTSVEFSPDALIVKSSGPLENKVSYDEIAIGMTGVSSAVKRVQSGKKLKILNVDGIEPTKENIGSGAYPFFRPLYLSVNPEAPNYSKVKQFLDWVLTDEAQAVIDSVGTVNVKQGTGLKDKFQYWETTEKIVNYDSL